MAKWGEGDPRWIVEERPDATNVNNWHWTEKNATEWSKNRLKSLLVDISVGKDGVGTCSTTEVSSIDGEATANNRKSKLIFFYEFTIKIKWTGKTASGTSVSGSINIPNLSEENDIDEVEVNVTLTGDETSEKRALKDLMRVRGKELVQAKLNQWLKELREEYALDLIKPTDANGKASAGTTTSSSGAATSAANKQTAQQSSSASVSDHQDTKDLMTVNVQEDFKCTCEDLYQALVDQQRIQMYTQSAAVSEARVGGSFSMFGNNVSGTYVELVENKKIVMKWRFSNWAAGHFSLVTMNLEDRDDSTRLILTQTGVPASDYERTNIGWRAQQFERMKMILGFGSGLNMSF